MLALLPDLLPLIVFVISFGLEPRKFRTGVYLFVAIGWLLTLLLAQTLSVAARWWSDTAAAYLLLGVLALGLLTALALAVFLIIAGITLVRREGFRVARLLSILLGSAIIVFLALGFFVVSSDSARLFVWFAMLGLPVVYLGFGFAAFVIYGSFYPAWMGRFGQPAAAVIVLGAGLIDGRVPPLLASRLRKGRKVYERSQAVRGDVRMLTSGGRGADEPVAEAVAMRDFLITEGVTPDAVLVEDHSRNTAQNLQYSAKVLAEAGVVGPVAVVTSDFHALRAALLMRKAGIPGYSVGARTTRYYWPTAVIREYVAVLRDHRIVNLVVAALIGLVWLVVLMSTLV